LQNVTLVNRLAVIGNILVLASGCFYTDPINQRPSLDIEQRSSALVYRGDQVDLEARVNDPDGNSTAVALQWRAYLCTDATPDSTGARPGCDQAPFMSAITPEFKFDVPTMRAPGATDPLMSLFVTLEGRDTLGDIVELRVEIEDRKHIQPACPDGDLTCSVISNPQCIQRLTWRVEIR
jgi:hypothetical protein